ncbi:twinfilin [Anaeramoeba flamelloides]|uniref:Twinfilin n=1 Tax=Anaeramoeba flamelloides TaxID=1746091 RepID=A0AAV7ZQE2_9EUKA|nr:twinfilin [Anaeramoeba flamelloides]
MSTNVEYTFSNEKKDFEMLKLNFEPNIPCYAIYRLDGESPVYGQDWLFITYLPLNNDPEISKKYENNKKNCQKQLGTNFFHLDIKINQLKDLSWKKVDQLRNMLQKQNKTTRINVKSNLQMPQKSMKTTLKPFMNKFKKPSVEVKLGEFSCNQNLLDSLQRLLQKEINCVQVGVDKTKDFFILQSAGIHDSIFDLVSSIPTNSPALIYYSFKHEHMGPRESVIILNSVPSKVLSNDKMYHNTAKVKINELSQKAKITVQKIIEVNNLQLLNHDFLLKKLYPYQRKYIRGNSSPRQQWRISRTKSRIVMRNTINKNKN